MRSVVAAGIIAAMSFLGAGDAFGGGSLLSAAIPPGSGGFVCACTNLTSESVSVSFAIKTFNGASFCSRTIARGFVGSCSLSSNEVSACHVLRHDDKSLVAKTFLCTMSAVDATGTPTVTVPVSARFY